MITISELNPHGYPTTPEIDENLGKLHKAVNIVRAAYGHPMIVSSGLRTLEDQLKINPSAPKSKHLIGAAVDILDQDGRLKKWMLAHPGIITQADLYCESFSCTPTWVHFQCIAPKSGNRYFFP